MTIGGSLAVHERAVGAVDIKVQSDDFKVIANKTADLKFDTDVHITGTVRAPKVEGTIEVEPGTIDVADVLQHASDPKRVLDDGDRDRAGRIRRGRSRRHPRFRAMFDALELRLGAGHSRRPAAQGNNIKPANAPIDVGDMNAYVGGAVIDREGAAAGSSG